ncbi:MAG: hypothetical protein WCO77_09890 [bacterium]
MPHHDQILLDSRAGYGAFFLKSALIAVLVLLAVAARTAYYWQNDAYQETIAGREIYWALKKSEQRQKTKVVILGDSIANQFYDVRNFNGETYSLACNQAISCVGHYLLLKKFLEVNADQVPEHVVLLIHPGNLGNNLNQTFTYHYFLKPFYTAKFRREFTPLVNAQIRKVPFFYLSQIPTVKISNWSPDLAPSLLQDQGPVAPITLEYLPKIKALCDRFGIDFCLLPVPVSPVAKASVDRKSAAYMENASSVGLTAEMRYYLDKLIVLDASFFVDGMHFHSPDGVRSQYVDGQLKERLSKPQRSFGDYLNGSR